MNFSYNILTPPSFCFQGINSTFGLRTSEFLHLVLRQLRLKVSLPFVTEPSKRRIKIRHLDPQCFPPSNHLLYTKGGFLDVVRGEKFKQSITLTPPSLRYLLLIMILLVTEKQWLFWL